MKKRYKLNLKKSGKINETILELFKA